MADNKKLFDIIFYIVAHADDWQLFMNPVTFNDIINPDIKVVFIVTTAGDAGKGETFWRAREEGMKSSIEYCLAPHQSLQYAEGYKVLDQWLIYFWSLNKTISYFLRLPDGGISAEGFKENCYSNLQKLEDGTITSLSSLDNKINLFNWNAFGELLNTIISLESVSAKGNIFIKFLDPDEQKNPHDHADHKSTGRAILDMKNLPVCTKVLFKGYGINCSNSLTAEEIFWKAGIFSAYEKTVFEQTGYSTLAENIKLYQKWLLSRPVFYIAK